MNTDRDRVNEAVALLSELKRALDDRMVSTKIRTPGDWWRETRLIWRTETLRKDLVRAIMSEARRIGRRTKQRSQA